MNLFLDALDDAWSQMTYTLGFVARAFGEDWRTGLAALVDRPAALFTPEQGAGLMRSVVHGFGWGIGREIAHNLFGHHRHW